MFRSTLSAGIGAALGASTRWALGLLFPQAWLIIAINILGSFVMGRLRPGVFWGKGFLGGFTSFSAFALALNDAPAAAAAASFLVTTMGAVGAWLLGAWLHDRQVA